VQCAFCLFKGRTSNKDAEEMVAIKTKCFLLCDAAGLFSPDIYMWREKELNFFPRTVDGLLIGADVSC